MREEYNFKAASLLEGIGISMEEYHSCAKIMDKTMHDAQNFFEFTKGIEDLIKAGGNPLLMRFMAMLVAQKVKEVQEWLYLNGGEKIPVSRRKYKEVHQKIIEFDKSWEG